MCIVVLFVSMFQERDTFINVTIDKVLPGSSKNPYRYMISDVFGTLFIIKVLL